ncbi:MAG TPA: NAD(P)/FAD-dependent oxidoreductase [Vicinamibacterales bacterium]|nr:NAD(P)/FAD-dependent oxidoreductase [Vicinamibacterales bacterium]
MPLHSDGPAAASPPRTVAIIGAGPAGLTAAYELVRRGVAPWVFDQDVRVGGLAQTVEHRGFRVDIGGQRFFTRVAAVRELWRGMLGADFLVRPRLSRIFYNGKLFQYPLRPLDALRKLGLRTSIAVIASYVRAQLFPVRPEVTFADWVGNRFGQRLYRIFFETYTRKVWGRSGEDIQAEWAAQRIKGLSPGKALLSMIRPASRDRIMTLNDEFEYPRLGPGMMWEAFARAVEAGGGRIRLRTRIAGLAHDSTRITAITLERDGDRAHRPVDYVISTMPLRELVHALAPPAPPDVRQAADCLKYRDFLTVALIVRRRDVFPDNWIYVHEPDARVGRIQNFKNWSPAMVPDDSRSCLGLEYFCSIGDDLWSRSDTDLVRLATDELVALGFVTRAEVEEGVVVRMPKAYPVYDDGYVDAVATIRSYLDRFSNLQAIGRNGMHKYNSLDHSMVTAMLAVRNYFGERHNIWAVNADDEYHEHGGPD